MCDICQEVCPFNRDRELGSEEVRELGSEAAARGEGAQDWEEGVEGTREGRNPMATRYVGAPLAASAIAETQNPKRQPRSIPHGSTPTPEPAFQPRNITIHSTVQDILMLTEEQFRVAFKGSPVKRAKWAGLRRNAQAASYLLAPDRSLPTPK